MILSIGPYGKPESVTQVSYPDHVLYMNKQILFFRVDENMHNNEDLSNCRQMEHMDREQNITVLLVDDEAIIRNSLELLLKKAGYIVASAKNAMIALDILIDFCPDICLIDIQLSGMNGRELSREILKRYPRTKIILMTGYSNIETVLSDEELQLFEILYKPVNIDELFETLCHASASRTST